MEYLEHQEAIRLNYCRFKQSERDSDSAKSVRKIVGRITKKRWQIIRRFCRLKSYSIPVYSDYDCTGQLCGHYLTPVFKHDGVSINLSLHYDC